MFQLEIIEEGLQLKLELRSIKEQFAGLLHNFSTFDETGHLPPVVAMEGGTMPLSATRARVRAVYEARKARLHAKRMAHTRESKQSPTRLWKRAKRDHPSDQQDKENRMTPVNSIVTSTPFFKQPVSHGRNSGCKTVLTPIKEEHWNTMTAASKHRIHRRHSCALTPHITPICHTPSREYIMLKSSLVSKGDYTPLSPNIPCAPNQSMVSDYPCPRNDTSIWSDDSRQSDITIDVSTKGGSPLKMLRVCQDRQTDSQGGRQADSPVQYASSEEISVVYTNRSLRDISQISQISRSSLREHRSSSNISGAFHSTFNYPLHSTLNYPLHSTMQYLEEPVVISDQQVDSGVKMCVSDAVAQSDCSSGIHSTSHQPPDTDKKHRKLGSMSKKSSDDEASEAAKSKKPHLCKEHGLHPTLGGPCIFQSDDSDLMDKLPPDHTIETDCDSSYLSEHIDDMSFSGTEDYVATYDARNARMKMLRRQTGQTQLKNIRHPIGLSESDLLFELTQKHMSMDATRASLPDLSVLTTVLMDENRSESTLIASPKKSQNSSRKDSDSMFSPNTTLMDVGPLAGPTTDESPESNTTLPVPMNSPMTDSGSSSRPTTDQYDYTEVSKVKTEMFPAPPSSSQNTNHQVFRASFKRHHYKGSNIAAAARNYPSCNSGKTSPSRELRTSQHFLRSHNRCESSVSAQTLKRHHTQAHHITISEASGATRTVIHHTAVARNLEHHKKKALVKKLKQFNNNFYSAQNLHLQTLGHF